MMLMLMLIADADADADAVAGLLKVSLKFPGKTNFNELSLGADRYLYRRSKAHNL